MFYACVYDDYNFDILISNGFNYFRCPVIKFCSILVTVVPTVGSRKYNNRYNTVVILLLHFSALIYLFAGVDAS